MSFASTTRSTSEFGVDAPNSATVKSGIPAHQRQAQQQYQRAKIETASPTQLIILLYEGAIRFCGQAIEAIEKKELESQNNYLIKAQRILAELMGALDRKNGGDVAENLFRLYVHMLEQLVEANLQDKSEPVKYVQKMLGELRDTWQEVERLAAQAQTPEANATATETAAPSAETNTEALVKPVTAPRPPAKLRSLQTLQAQVPPTGESRLGDQRA